MNGTPPVFFLNTPCMKESDEQLMNFGLRDQLEALRWIQEMLVWIGRGLEGLENWWALRYTESTLG